MVVLVAMSMLFSTTAIAGDEGRYEEKYNYNNEWLYAVLLFSPEYEKERAVWSFEPNDVIAIDTFGGHSRGIWNYIILNLHEDTLEYDLWPHALFVDADIVPFGDIPKFQKHFDAIFMVRQNTFFDIGSLIEDGWTLGDLEIDNINKAVIVVGQDDTVVNLFEPMELDSIYSDHTIYRIPAEFDYVFAQGNVLD